MCSAPPSWRRSWAAPRSSRRSASARAWGRATSRTGALQGCAIVCWAASRRYDSAGRRTGPVGRSLVRAVRRCLRLGGPGWRAAVVRRTRGRVGVALRAGRPAGGGSSGAPSRLGRSTAPHGADAARCPDLLDARRFFSRSRRAVRDPRQATAGEARRAERCAAAGDAGTGGGGRACRGVEDPAARVRHFGVGAGARSEGDDGFRYGAFGGLSEYCRTRRHGRLGRGAGVPLAAQTGAARGGDRGGGRGGGVPPFARGDAEQALRRPPERRGGTGGSPGPGDQPVSRSGPGAGSGRDPTLPRPLGRQDRDPQRHGAHRDRAQMGRRRALEGRPPGLSGCPGAHHHPGAGIHDAVIQHIDVHAVLQESVSGVYTDLVTRPTGRVVREHIERAIATAPDPVTVTRIDFTGVGCIDYSCADEIVAKLLRDRRVVVVLSGLSEGHREAIEPVLAGHGLAALIERRRDGGGGDLEALGAPEAAAALVHELVARGLAERTPAGTIALTLA